MTIDEAEPNNMNVVHPCAAGLHVHKTSAAASVRVWKGGGEATTDHVSKVLQKGFKWNRSWQVLWFRNQPSQM